MGGDNIPSDLLISRDTMKKLATSPSNFILAIPLPPNHYFTREEVNKMENSIKGDTVLEKSIEETVVIWKGKGTTKNPLWEAPRPVEGLSTKHNTYIMGGKASFWPLPLQREGPCSTVMWKTILPDDHTPIWLTYLGEQIQRWWRGYFWTLSKR